MKNLILFFFLVISFGLSAQSMTTKDCQFATDALQAGMLEIRLSELAVTNAASEEVKRLAQEVIQEHTKTNTELKALAVTKKVTVPTSLTAEGQKRYDDLALKTGSSFDHAYSEMMVKDHQKAVAMFKEENLSGSDKDLKNMASITLPVLEHHLMMANDAVASLK